MNTCKKKKRKDQNNIECMKNQNTQHTPETTTIITVLMYEVYV